MSLQQQEYEQEFLQRRFSGGSHSYGGDSPRLSPCSSMGKLSKSDEQLSSIEQDSGQCSRNTSCETLGKKSSYSALNCLFYFLCWSNCLHKILKMGAYLNVNNVQNQEKYVLFFAQIVDRKVKKNSQKFNCEVIMLC